MCVSESSLITRKGKCLLSTGLFRWKTTRTEPFGAEVALDSEWIFGLCQLQGSQAREYFSYNKTSCWIGVKMRQNPAWLCEVTTSLFSPPDPTSSVCLLNYTMADSPRERVGVPGLELR